MSIMPLAPTFSPNPDMHSAAVAAGALQADPQLLTNINQELGFWWSSEADRAEAMDMRNAAQDYQTKVLRLVLGWESGVYGYFDRFHANGRESARYIMGEQWSELDRQKHLEERRRAYEFDIITPFLNAMLGEQTTNRFDWNATAINATMPEEQQADIMNHYLTWVAQSGEVKWSQTSFKVFKDFLVRGFGICYVGMDPQMPMNRILVQQMRPEEFMWDLDSTLDEWFTGTRYFERRYRKNRMSLAYQYREWMPEILSMSPYTTTSAYPGDDFFNAVNPRVHALSSEGGAWSGNSQFSTTGLIPQTLPVREFYERRSRPMFCVYDGLADKTYFQADPMKAVAIRRGLEEFWMQQGGDLLRQVGAQSPVLTNVNPCEQPVVDQYIMIGPMLVRVNSVATNRFPYEGLIDWYDGTITSFVDRGKDPQRYINRTMSTMDKVAGALAPHAIIDKHFLSQKLDDEVLLDKAAEAGSAFLIDSKGRPDFEPSKAFYTTPSLQIGSAVSQLYNIAAHSLQQYYGGSTVVGQADYAGQSGVSQNTLVARASTTSMPLFELFRIFAERVGERVCDSAQFLDPATRMTVVDETRTATVKSFSQSGIKDLTQLKFHISISERTSSPSESQRRVGLLLQLAGQMPDKAQAFLNIILKRYMDVSWEDRNEILQYIAQQEAAAQQLAGRQQALAEQIGERKMRVAEGGLMVKASLADLAAQNLPTSSIAIKLPATPEIVAAMGTKAGVAMHPAAVAGSMAQKAIADQDIRDMAQVHEQEHWTPAQRALQEAAAARINKMKSQRDAVSRSQKGEEETN